MYARNFQYTSRTIAMAARGAFAAVFFLGLTPAAIAQQSALAQKSSEPAQLTAIAQQQGQVRVIVLFESPVPPSEIRADAASIAGVTSAVSAMQDAILSAHFGSATPGSGPNFERHLTRFPITPGFALNVTEAELQALAADPRITRINQDVARPPALTQSVPLIGMNNVYGQGGTGATQAVAVVDTGVHANHEFLAGKVVREACFSNASPSGTRVSLCPNGGQSQAGAGAASALTAACQNGGTNLCNHGSHVAGIAAGNNSGFNAGEPPNGVARSAAISAVQVFTRFNSAADCNPNPAPCVLTWDSDQVNALNNIFGNLNLPGGSKVASVNMSLGGGSFAGTCDGESVKPAIDALRNAGVITAIASGNSSFTNAIGSPGCVSTAFTVGSSTKADGISSFSNQSAIVDVMAPGTAITSSIPPGNSYSSFNGTSMATPHVAGAIAAIRSACPSVSAASIENALRGTGTTIIDNRPGGQHHKPRIRVDLALNQLGCVFPPGPPGPVSCNFPNYTRLRDFNADGRADIVFRRPDGLTSVYFMNGLQIQSGQIIGAIGNDWQLMGVNDFNGDGRADLLFRRPNGQISIYLMNGANVIDAQIIGAIGTDWNIIGVGDFNGDGRADFVTRRADGLVAIYFMNGFQVMDAQVVGTIGLEWKLQGIADFSGSGRSGMLLRRVSDGMISVFLLNGAQIINAAIVGIIGTDWTIVGVGDFNGDGRADFITRRASGQLGMYLLNGTQLIAGQAIGSVGVDWTFVATGDLNGDGKHDMVFRRSTGALSAYLLNGFQILDGKILGAIGSDWNSCYGQGQAVVAGVSE